MLGPTNTAKFSNDWRYQPETRPMGLNTIGRTQYSNTYSTLSTTSSMKIGPSPSTSDTGVIGGFFVGPTANFDFGTGDFTVEYWVYNSSSGGSGSTGFMFRMDTLGPGYSYSASPDVNKIALAVNGLFADFQLWANDTVILESTLNIFTNNVWHSVAVVRSSGVVSLYIDGTTIFTGSVALTDDISNNGFIWFGGGDQYWMQEIRVSNIARYTSNYTPATTQFTNDSNTLLLCHCTGTPGDNLFLDDDS